MKRTLIIAGIVLVLAAGGILAYSQLRPRPTGTAARGDPALMVAVAVGALLRSETYGLTDEQMTRLLPLMRVLRDTDPNDADASRALAEAISTVFTPEQRAELERLREEARARRQERQAQAGAPGRGPRGVGGQPGGRPAAEVRRRLLGRLIERLEDRVQ